jgi:prepilin peptidase CpaA
MTSLHDILLIALYVILSLAAVADVWKLRIPNLFPAAVILLFPVWMYSCGWNPQLWQNAVVFIGTFMGGLFLFSRGWLGGGDVKLMAAIALWFDFKGAAALYLWMGIGGAMLAIAFILLRRMLPSGIAQATSVPSLKAGGPIPYGLAISAGAMLAIVGGNINPQPKPGYLDPASLMGTHIASAASIMMS